MQPPSATTPAPSESPTGLLLPPATSSLPSGLNNLAQRPMQFFPEQAASTPATPTSSIITPSRPPHPGPFSNPPARTLVDLPGRSNQPDRGVVGPHPRPSSSPPPIPSSPALLTPPTSSSTNHRSAPPPALDYAVGCDPSFPVQLGDRSSARPPDQAADSYAARIEHLEKVIQVLLARSKSTKPLCDPNLRAELAFVVPLVGSFQYSMDRGLQPVLSRATTASLTKDWRDRGRNGQFNPITPPGLAPSRLSRTRPSANFQPPSTASQETLLPTAALTTSVSRTYKRFTFKTLAATKPPNSSPLPPSSSPRPATIFSNNIILSPFNRQQKPAIQVPSVEPPTGRRVFPNIAQTRLPSAPPPHLPGPPPLNVRTPSQPQPTPSSNSTTGVDASEATPSLSTCAAKPPSQISSIAPPDLLRPLSTSPLPKTPPPPPRTTNSSTASPPPNHMALALSAPPSPLQLRSFPGSYPTPLLSSTPYSQMNASSNLQLAQFSPAPVLPGPNFLFSPTSSLLA
ncbi:hypothetical protein PTTG_25424 [Puccinia triticina 1-1 BBBD Race 1]|uniref:Uncharacterized protein n=1 Tax=Puccinia triticina (isolate 1-1 / race 1 (BBBD)) TaxID=630390 RepID=A0A180H2Y1_PUCT1|nr:hypothetical protein PTTG_25424 [Puccinia triticina 1-1 BBBD Race 1]